MLDDGSLVAARNGNVSESSSLKQQCELWAIKLRNVSVGEEGIALKTLRQPGMWWKVSS